MGLCVGARASWVSGGMRPTAVSGWDVRLGFRQVIDPCGLSVWCASSLPSAEALPSAFLYLCRLLADGKEGGVKFF